MNTLVGAAEPDPQPQPWPVNVAGFVPARCPYSGISTAMGCRARCCRPDLYGSTATNLVWPFVLDVGAARTVLPGWTTPNWSTLNLK